MTSSCSPPPPKTELWVDPVSGRDDADGQTRATALRTIAAAWQRIPSDGAVAEHGWRIWLCAGVHAADSRGFATLNDRRGGASGPIEIIAADQSPSVRVPPIDANDCSHLNLIGLTIASESLAGVPASEDNLVHFARCHHVLVRGVSATGESGSRGLPRLAFKANQCSHLSIEDCVFGGSTAYAFAYVAVQHGHILRSRFGPCGAAGICLKGGSAYHLVAGNDVSSCRIMGITIGEGTGFAYLVSPWLQYEAYDIAVIGNTIRDSGGALCVAGGYGILMAHNTAYRVGSSRDAVVIAMGSHGWVGQPDSAKQICEEFHRAGGWCSPTESDGSHIPCRNVTIINNLICNPDGYESQFAHIGLSGPVAASPDSNIPDPATMENIRIEGNLIWNGGPDKPVLDDVEHCYGLAARPTASAPALRAINRLNTVRPILTDPDHGDFRPMEAGATLDAITLDLPLFDMDGAHRPPVPVDERGRSAVAALLRTYRCIGAHNPS